MTHETVECMEALSTGGPLTKTLVGQGYLLLGIGARPEMHRQMLRPFIIACAPKNNKHEGEEDKIVEQKDGSSSPLTNTPKSQLVIE